MKRRTWIYIQNPVSYEFSCDRCEGKNITWSEYEGCIWCFDCKIDTRGNEGIFGGPIPLEVSEMLGVRFDRFYFRDKSIRKMEVKGDRLVWRKEKNGIFHKSSR